MYNFENQKKNNGLVVRPEWNVRIEYFYLISLRCGCPDFCPVPVTRSSSAGQFQGFSDKERFCNGTGFHNTIGSGYSDIDLLDKVQSLSSSECRYDQGIN